MPLTSIPLLPLFLLLPGLAFFTLFRSRNAKSETAGEDRQIGVTDLLFLSIALSGWIAQTLALEGRFTIPSLTLSITVLCLAALFSVRGPRAVPPDIRRLALTAARPSAVAMAAALAMILMAVLLYRPPGVALLENDPAPALHSLGIHLARTGALPQPAPDTGLAGAPEAMLSAAGPGLLFPAWIGLLHLIGGVSWSSACPAIFAALSLAVIFGLGRQATGSSWFGAAMLLALGLNYPQSWLARVSVPESAAQFLVLSSALFFLRSRDGFPGIPAAAVSLGAAALCAPALLWFIPPALVLLMALHAAGPSSRRRQAALFCLGVLPFLVQGWLQAVLLGGEHGFLPPLPAGSAHWMTWYLTLPFLVLLAFGLLLMLARPAAALRLVSGLGPLFTLALVSLPFLLRAPGSTADQPWAVRPFTVAVIPASLLVGLLFFHRVLQWLRHPALRCIWLSFLAVLLGLNLANQLPMATGRPGQGARLLVDKAARPLAAEQPPFTAVVEDGLGSVGLHTALAGVHGIRSFSLRGDPQDHERFHALVRENAASGRRTALVVSGGAFTPDPDAVTLRPMASVVEDVRRLLPETDHLPSSVISRTLRLQILEALPAVKAEAPADRSPLTVRVGIYSEDWPWLAGGFRALSTAGGRPHRWTGKLALLRVPSWAARVELILGGFRPPGAPAAVVSAGFSGRPRQLTRHLPREGFVSMLVTRPGNAPNRNPVNLELHSTCFRPDSWLTGSDGEPLGFQLASITFHPAGN